MTVRVLLMVAVIFTLSTFAFGQTSRGTVTGTVTDPNGAVIAGAEVTLTSAATKLSRNTTTNSEGLYRFEAVDSGTYSVKVKATGFGEVVSTGIEVQANQASDVPTQMAPAGQIETVNVAAAAGQLLQVEAPVRGGNIWVRVNGPLNAAQSCFSRTDAPGRFNQSLRLRRGHFLRQWFARTLEQLPNRRH